MRVLELPLRLSRHAVSPRNVARAGDLWRLCQEAAIQASVAAGWNAARYVREQIAFVVRSMTVVHDREVSYDESLVGRTWVGDFRRGMLSRREVRIEGGDGRVAAATQEWVHVALTETGARPARGSDALLDAFTPAAVDEPSAQLPGHDGAGCEGSHVFSFDIWHTWMDPLGHVNHAVFVDWLDEALARRLGAAGLDPQGAVPVADRIRFRGAALAGDRMTVRSRLLGRCADGTVAIGHEVTGRQGPVISAVTVRGLAGGDHDALAGAVRV